MESEGLVHNSSSLLLVPGPISPANSLYDNLVREPIVLTTLTIGYLFQQRFWLKF
jgi:hypothetical protein